MDNSELIAIQPLDSDDFLPPVHPWMRWGGISCMVIFGIVIGLAMVLPVNVKVRAIAEVRPREELQVVRATVAGLVTQINVHANDPVVRGQAIVHLAPTDLQSFPPPNQSLDWEFVQIQRNQTILQAEQEAVIQQIWVEAEVIPPQPLPLDLAEAVDLALARIATERSPTLAQDLSHQYATIAEKLRAVNQQMQQYVQDPRHLEQLINQPMVRSPLAGTVLRLGVQSEGQLVQPGMPIAEIVPSESTLVVRAQVAVQDIGQVQRGQLAQMQISAYPYPDYGILAGTVTAIAPDAIPCDRNPCYAATIYQVEIVPSQAYLIRDGVRHPLQPGMTVTVDIISRRERLMVLVLRKLRLWVGS